MARLVPLTCDMRRNAPPTVVGIGKLMFLLRGREGR